MSDAPAAKITVTENGPYMVAAGTPLHDKDGNAIETSGNYFLCRCGGSSSKPFCDVTHLKNNFVG